MVVCGQTKVCTGPVFLGLGGFNMEKIVLACLGTYLEPSGIFDVLVETECYGTDVIKTVISGSHYARGPHCPFNDTRGPHIHDLGSIPLQIP